ncbi:MAG: hypothetical protein V9G19_08775 [Tetrasphaera sp.]
MALDPDWNLTNRCGRMPVFSARTFLSPAEMRPTVWLRWKNDPACRDDLMQGIDPAMVRGKAARVTRVGMT